ncbi:conjugal transfer protein [Bacilli bacterium]|nr:hypothetical protein WH51_11495 [Bacilli bacterium VT-13-104]PZD83162.1 conjugal transfer protein [Bacilli bacterium]PZD84274.1 conjugal transfer protein [Bacilli bacterium]PZD86305.1 conjugal transfer protein [Bacilli bacterium]RCO04286.1 conjugal transfer protein [Bacilli bacterium]
MADKKGKEFIFPDNVESGYNLIKGVTVKTFFTVLLPFIVIGGLIIAIPPYSLVFVLIRVFIALIVVTIGFAVVVSRPIKSRENITVIHHLKFLREYNKRQKLFYISTKKKG